MYFYGLRRAARGFTLVELLVVIAIIGMLASIVLTSLAPARQKGRDVRRIGDLKQLQNAIELYAADHNGIYPGTQNQWYDNSCAIDDGPSYPDINPLLAGYHTMPADSNGKACIWYVRDTTGTGQYPWAVGYAYFLLIFPENPELVARGQGCYPSDPAYYCIAVK